MLTGRGSDDDGVRPGIFVGDAGLWVLLPLLDDRPELTALLYAAVDSPSRGRLCEAERPPMLDAGRTAGVTNPFFEECPELGAGKCGVFARGGAEPARPPRGFVRLFAFVLLPV